MKVVCINFLNTARISCSLLSWVCYSNSIYIILKVQIYEWMFWEHLSKYQAFLPLLMVSCFLAYHKVLCTVLQQEGRLYYRFCHNKISQNGTVIGEAKKGVFNWMCINVTVLYICPFLVKCSQNIQGICYFQIRENYEILEW